MRRFRANLICAIVVLTAASIARAAERSEALLRLVGEDVGLCVEISDLNHELPTLLRSDLGSRLKGLELYREWLESNDHRKLVKSRDSIEKFAGKPFDKIAYDLFGRAVVVAIYPTPGGSTKGVILTQAADTKTLDWSLETWNRQKSIKTETLEYGGWKYTRRVRENEKSVLPQTLFYVRFEETYALSDHEPTIRRIIDLHAAKAVSQSDAASSSHPKSLLDSARFQNSQRDLSAASVVRAYLNPHACRSCSDLFGGDGHDPLREMAAAAWKRCESIGAALRYDDGLVVELNLNYDSQGVPAEWKRTLEVTNGRPGFLSRVPWNASVAFAGRVDAARFARTLESSLGDPQQGQWSGALQVARGLLLGRDPLKEVIPALGSDWAWYLVPRQNAKPGELPADMLFAIELPVDQSLRGAFDNAFNTGLNYVASQKKGNATSPAAVVRSKEDGPTRIRWVENLGHIEPACAMTHDALVFATSPALIDQFNSSTTDDKLVASPLYQKLSPKYLADESQLMLVNLAAVRRFVEQHPALFDGKPDKASADAPADAKRKDSEPVRDVLKLFDAAFVSGRLDENRVRVVAGAVLLPAAEESTSAPLSK